MFWPLLAILLTFTKVEVSSQRAVAEGRISAVHAKGNNPENQILAYKTRLRATVAPGCSAAPGGAHREGGGRRAAPRPALSAAPRRRLMHGDRGVQRRGLSPGTARVPLVPRRASPARCSHLRLHESNDALVALMRSPATRPFVPGRAPLSLVALRHDGRPPLACRLSCHLELR